MYTQLNINNYCSEFILGNNPEEKLKKRKVIINISLRFMRKDCSCISDNLQDTVCYDELLRFLDSKLKDAEFNLIEKATSFIFENLEEYLKNIRILEKVRVLKRVEVIKPEPFANNPKITNSAKQNTIQNINIDLDDLNNRKKGCSAPEKPTGHLESTSFLISEWY